MSGMGHSLYLAWRYLRFQWLKTVLLIASITIVLFLPAGLQALVDASSDHLLRRAAATPLVVGAGQRAGAGVEHAVLRIAAAAGAALCGGRAGAVERPCARDSRLLPLYRSAATDRRHNARILRVSRRARRSRPHAQHARRMRHWRRGGARASARTRFDHHVLA